MTDPEAASAFRAAEEVTILADGQYTLRLTVVDTSPAALKFGPLLVNINHPINLRVTPLTTTYMARAIYGAAETNPLLSATRALNPAAHSTSILETECQLANVISATAMKPSIALQSGRCHAVHAFTSNSNLPAITLINSTAPQSQLYMYFANSSSLAFMSLSTIHESIRVTDSHGELLCIIHTAVPKTSPSPNFPTAINISSKFPIISCNTITSLPSAQQGRHIISPVALADLASEYVPGQSTSESYGSRFVKLADKWGRESTPNQAFLHHASTTLLRILTQPNHISLTMRSSTADNDQNTQLTQQLSSMMQEVLSSGELNSSLSPDTRLQQLATFFEEEVRHFSYSYKIISANDSHEPQHTIVKTMLYHICWILITISSTDDDSNLRASKPHRHSVKPATDSFSHPKSQMMPRNTIHYLHTHRMRAQPLRGVANKLCSLLMMWPSSHLWQTTCEDTVDAMSLLCRLLDYKHSHTEYVLFSCFKTSGLICTWKWCCLCCSILEYPPAFLQSHQMTHFPLMCAFSNFLPSYYLAVLQCFLIFLYFVALLSIIFYFLLLYAFYYINQIRAQASILDFILNHQLKMNCALREIK